MSCKDVRCVSCSGDTMSFSSADDATSFSRLRKNSASSNNSSPSHTPSLTHSHSNPDLTLSFDDARSEFPEHVIKVYKADQAFKYLLIHRVRDVTPFKLNLSASKTHLSLLYFSILSGDNRTRNCDACSARIWHIRPEQVK